MRYREARDYREPPRPEKDRLVVYLPKTIRAELAEMAKAEGVSLSQLLWEVTAQGLDTLKGPIPPWDPVLEPCEPEGPATARSPAEVLGPPEREGIDDEIPF